MMFVRSKFACSISRRPPPARLARTLLTHVFVTEQVESLLSVIGTFACHGLHLCIFAAFCFDLIDALADFLMQHHECDEVFINVSGRDCGYFFVRRRRSAWISLANNR